MIVIKTNEAGYEEAVFGDGLSFGKTSGKPITDFIDAPLYDDYEIWESCKKRTTSLSQKERGHDGSLALIQIWLDITAPRFWWQQFDTYTFKNQRSESTMHTLLKEEITERNFSGYISPRIIKMLNDEIEAGNFQAAKNILPESFLQRRIVSTNYLTLKNIFIQRKNHKLSEWQRFIWQVAIQVNHPKLLPNVTEVIQNISDEETKKRQ